MRRLPLLAVAVLSLLASPVSATIVVDLPSIASCGVGCWTWSYGVTLSPGSGTYQVNADNFFTIYDFGLVLGFSQPTGWDFSDPATGPNPTGFTPLTDSSAANLSWEFNGSIANITASGSDVFLGTFSANSPFSGVQVGQYAAADQQLIPLNLPSTNSGFTRVPAPVPEPSTLVLLGGGLIAVALYRRRRT